MKIWNVLSVAILTMLLMVIVVVKDNFILQVLVHLLISFLIVWNKLMENVNYVIPIILNQKMEYVVVNTIMIINVNLTLIIVNLKLWKIVPNAKVDTI